MTMLIRWKHHGFGTTLAAALRNVADELERYGCDARPQDMRDPEKVKQTCFREQCKRLTLREVNEIDDVPDENNGYFSTCWGIPPGDPSWRLPVHFSPC